MAKLIEEIAMMSESGQEFVLSNLQRDYRPIEIDGIVYMIPSEVSALIKSLCQLNSERVQSKQNQP